MNFSYPLPFEHCDAYIVSGSRQILAAAIDAFYDEFYSECFIREDRNLRIYDC